MEIHIDKVMQIWTGSAKPVKMPRDHFIRESMFELHDLVCSFQIIKLEIESMQAQILEIDDDILRNKFSKQLMAEQVILYKIEDEIVSAIKKL